MNGRIRAPQRYGAYNLLDNSDFTHPVNQRSIATGRHEGYGYRIDRWYFGLSSVDGAYFGLSDGFISMYPPTSGFAQLEQNLERYSLMKGGTYTFAARVAYKGVQETVVTSFVMGNLAVGQNLFDDGSLQLYSADGVNIAIRFHRTETPYELVLYWAALYEGAYTADTLPPYVPKGYAAELMECQRYYLHNVGKFTAGYFYDATTFYLYIDLPIPMRAKPNATLVTADNITVNYNNMGKIIPVTGISAVEKMNERILKISLTVPDNDIGQWTTGWTFNTTINLSADL